MPASKNLVDLFQDAFSNDKGKICKFGGAVSTGLVLNPEGPRIEKIQSQELSGPNRAMQPRCAMRFESHIPESLAMRTSLFFFFFFR